uniref:Btz domain-containing protein n=1 Tax=Strigamia maritima TaxID=126957 RepID=T1JFE2_STRMM
MKKESHNDKAQDRRVKPNKPFRLDSNSRNQLEVFQGAEKIGPGGDVLLAPVRNFRNEFAANVAPETTFCHDRRDMKRFQSGNLEEEVYGRKNAERMFRPEEQVMSGPAYDPEELKKITVDIRRSIPRDGEIIVRRITNPEQVVLVRRPEEGARPIFDRDEIKQGNLEREEEFREKRVVAIVRERGRSRSPIPTMDTQSEMHENFKVHRVNSYDAEAFQARPSLSDRWQHDRKSANEKSGNEKLLVSVRPGSPQQMIRKLTNYRGHDIPDELIDEQLYRNIRSMVYRDDATMPRMSSRDSNERHHDGFDTRRPIPTNPHDLRHSLISRGRPVDLLDARQKILERQEREPVHQEAYERNKDRGGSLERAPRSSTVTWDRERIREKILEGLPNFAARRDRYQYKEWIDKPDVVPKGPSYFEHDTRGEGNLEFRRGQGYRGGAGRGSGSSFRSRGAFRARGRPSSFTTNYVTRHIVERGRTDQVGGLGKRSPHQWEHDMFEPADKMKMDEDARPI